MVFHVCALQCVHFSSSSGRYRRSYVCGSYFWLNPLIAAPVTKTGLNRDLSQINNRKWIWNLCGVKQLEWHVNMMVSITARFAVVVVVAAAAANQLLKSSVCHSQLDAEKRNNIQDRTVVYSFKRNKRLNNTQCTTLYSSWVDCRK